MRPVTRVSMQLLDPIDPTTASGSRALCRYAEQRFSAALAERHPEAFIASSSAASHVS